MNNVNQANDGLLQCVELQTEETPLASVIWMHGLGADAYDFVPIVKELHLKHTLPIRFIFPNAPVQPVTINQGYAMRSWYDIISLERIAQREDEKGLRESEQKISDLIAREIARGIPSHRIVLAGFSQGGAMTLQTGLRYSQSLAGLIVLSSYLPLAHLGQAEFHEANRKTPIFMAHGTQDPVVQYTWGSQSKESLQNFGYHITWQEYAMQHSVCPEEIDDISEFLQTILPRD